MTDTQAAQPDDLDLAIKAEIDKASATLETAKTIETPVTTSTEETEIKMDEPITAEQTESEKFQARINKKHWEMMEAKREAEALRLQIDEYKRSQPVKIDTNAPKLENFKLEDYGYDDSARLAAYTDSLTDYKLNNFTQVQQQKQYEQVNQQRQAELNNKFLSEVESYASEHPSYYQEVVNLPLMPQDKLDLLRSQGAKMVHYLARNPDIAQDFVNSDLALAGFKLGTIAAKLSSAQPKQKISSAPDPVKSISGSGALTKQKHEMSIEEIMNLP
jgi:hypothetical protein